MHYIDLHCDTVMPLWEDIPGKNLLSNTTASVDLQRLQRGGAMAQFFAIFLLTESAYTRLGRPRVSDDDYISEMTRMVKKAAESAPDRLAMAYNAADLQQNFEAGKVSAFLTIEDGRSVTSLEKLRQYHQQGIRLISLTWNYENCLAFPNSLDPEVMGKGLKPLGFEVVAEMEGLGVIVDTSHLSDGGFADLAAVAKKPFIASHSNPRAISPHQRNLTDEQLRILAEHGGVAGLNFAPGFLSADTQNQRSSIELLVKNLDYMRNIGGEDLVALGSDFDGIQGDLEIDSADKMPLLFQALEKDGWTARQIEKFAWRNALRVIEAVM